MEIWIGFCWNSTCTRGNMQIWLVSSLVREKCIWCFSWDLFGFCIELTGILIQRGLLELFSTTSGVVGATSKGDTPPHNIPVSLDGKGTEDGGE